MIRKLPKIFAIWLCFCFIFEQTGIVQVSAQVDIPSRLPQIHNSLSIDKFRPLHLRYFSYDTATDNFRIYLDKGDVKSLQGPELEITGRDLLNYFLIGVTLPDDKFWVNLRPDSEDRIIDDALTRTDIGRILLEADLQLKKDMARYTSPETPEGKEYWSSLYRKAEELYGSEDATIPTFTRPWIVPDEIIIRETSDSAYVFKATLKVLLEQDHLKNSAAYNFDDPRLKALNEYSSQLLRETILPKLTKEVNLSRHYAPLRQVFYSLILARWFKSRFYGKSGRYSDLINKSDLTGLTAKESWSKTVYFKEYLKSFKNGEYNITERVSTSFDQTIRSYCSGGVDITAPLAATTQTAAARISTRSVELGTFTGSPAHNLPRALAESGRGIELTGSAGSLQLINSTGVQQAFQKIVSEKVIAVRLEEEFSRSELNTKMTLEELKARARAVMTIDEYLGDLPLARAILENGFSLGLTTVTYAALSRVSELTQWREFYRRMGWDERERDDEHLGEIDSRGTTIVFFVPRNIFTHQRANVVRKEIEWLLSHPRALNKVVFIFGTPAVEDGLAETGLSQIDPYQMTAVLADIFSKMTNRHKGALSEQGVSGDTRVSFVKQISNGISLGSAVSPEVRALIESSRPVADMQGIDFSGTQVNFLLLDPDKHQGVLFEADGSLRSAMGLQRQGESTVNIFVASKTLELLRSNPQIRDALIQHEILDSGEEGAHRRAWQQVKKDNPEGMKQFLLFEIDHMALVDMLSLVTEYENDVNGRGEGRVQSGEWNAFEKEIYEFCKDRIARSIPASLNDLVELFGNQRMLYAVFGSEQMLTDAGRSGMKLNSDIIEALAKAWDVDRFVVEARLISAFYVYQQLKTLKAANDKVLKDFESNLIAAAGEPVGRQILGELARETHQSWLSTVKGPGYVPYNRAIQDFLIQGLQSGAVTIKGITAELLANPNKKFKIKKSDIRFYDPAAEQAFWQFIRRSPDEFSDTAVLFNTVAGEWDDLFGWSDARNKYLYNLQAENVGSIINALSDPKLVERLTTGTVQDRQQAVVDILRKINAGWRLNNPWGGFTDRLINKPFGLDENGGIGLDDIMKDFAVLKAMLAVLHDHGAEMQAPLGKDVVQAIDSAFDNGLSGVLEVLGSTDVLREAVRVNVQKFPGNRRITFSSLIGLDRISYAKSPGRSNDGLENTGTLSRVAALPGASEILGGIDFRSMNVLVQPMGTFSGLNYTLPVLPAGATLNIDNELKTIKDMIAGGRAPAGQRIKELIAACLAQNQLGNHADEMLLYLANIFQLEEENLAQSSQELKEALVILDANKFVEQ